MPPDLKISSVDMGKVSGVFLWLKLVLTTIVIGGVIGMMVLIPPNEIPGIWVALFLYTGLLLRLNWHLRDGKVNWFWLIVALCVPFIGVLIAYATISRAVVSTQRRNGEIL